MHWRSLSASGIVISLVGFILTRFTVTLAAHKTATQFLFAGIVPLVLGLTLTVFGIVLTVGSYDPVLVRTTARWCLIGTATMGVLVVITLLGAQPEGMMRPAVLREQTYLSNFMIGGAVGGTLTGLYAARNRRHRMDLRRQANRLTLLNRLLRDQVINAATAIKGHSEMLSETRREESIEVIGRQAGNVIDTVEDVKYLSKTADRSDLTLGPVDVVDCLDSQLERVRQRHPEAMFDWTAPEGSVEVRANAQLGEVFWHLLDNAAAYSDSDRPEIDVVLETTRTGTQIRIVDDGPGLPDDQRRLLEAGEIAEFDDPTTGFGLNIVRLLVESFDGDIETSVDDGTTITLELPGIGARPAQAGSSLTMPGVAPAQLALAVGASLLAGAAMGVTMDVTGVGVPIIGALYGVEDVLVGVISHEFHSVVFGLGYAGLLSAVPVAYSRGLRNRLAIAVGLAFFLWLVAAGIVMPLWLELLGLQATVPMLTVPTLLGHLVWGVTLGVVYHYGIVWQRQSATQSRRYLVELLERG